MPTYELANTALSAYSTFVWAFGILGWRVKGEKVRSADSETSGWPTPSYSGEKALLELGSKFWKSFSWPTSSIKFRGKGKASSDKRVFSPQREKFGPFWLEVHFGRDCYLRLVFSNFAWSLSGQDYGFSFFWQDCESWRLVGGYLPRLTKVSASPWRQNIFDAHSILLLLTFWPQNLLMLLSNNEESTQCLTAVRGWCWDCSALYLAFFMLTASGICYRISLLHYDPIAAESIYGCSQDTFLHANDLQRIPRWRLLAKSASALYINPLYQPAWPRAQPKWSHFFGAHALISSWSPCQLCTCISSLHNEAAKFSWLPPVHPWFIRVCKERVGGGCRKLYTVKRGWVVGVVESCLRVVGRPIRPLFRLYSPPLPPFPPRIRAGGPTYQPPLFQASNTLT